MNIIITLCYIYIALYVILLIVSIFNGGYNKTLSLVITKICDWYDPAYPTSHEWDCKVFNWLIEDDLKIKIPLYSEINGGKVYSINTPLGEIWASNYPYCFGHNLDDKQNHQPLQETKEKLFHRLSEFLEYDKEGHCFRIK